MTGRRSSGRVSARSNTSGAADPVGEGGHGLILVDALATRWGSTVNDFITKTVWAELEDGPRAELADAARDLAGTRAGWWCR